MLPDLSAELDDLKSRGLHRSLRLLDGPQDPCVYINGRPCLLFCSNNYLGLANHPALREAAADALGRFGVSAAASRLVCGTQPPHLELESRLARFLGTEAALAFPTGYMANLGAVTALIGPQDAVFSDRLNHRSLIDACRTSRAATFVYPHRDLDGLHQLLRAETGYRRRMILTDGLFSMDGDLAPLPGLADLARAHRAILMVDDAHGTGVLGSTGRGAHEHFGLTDGIDILMTSGSKALGAYGGFIAGSAELVDLLLNRSPSFIYTTALPPDICAATTAALRLLETDAAPRSRLLENVRFVREGLRALGFNLMDSQSQIIPVHIGDARETVALSNRLFERGIFLSAIRPPTVPEGHSRLRLTVMASHTEEHLKQLLDAMAALV